MPKISERTLKSIRTTALKASKSIKDSVKVSENWTEPVLNRHEAMQLYGYILRLTQELLDQYLLEKK